MIGKLRHRIILKKPVAIKDPIGQDLEIWQDIASVWANIEPLSGKEYFNAQQVNSEITTKITIRYIKNLNSHWVVHLGHRVFNILSVINLEERNRYLQLLCSEKVGDDID